MVSIQLAPIFIKSFMFEVLLGLWIVQSLRPFTWFQSGLMESKFPETLQVWPELRT